jgi:hypothetical protein
MQPLLPEKESRNGTGATGLAQAKYRAASIPLSAGFRYPSSFDRYWPAAHLVRSVVSVARSPAPALSSPALASPCGLIAFERGGCGPPSISESTLPA